MEICLYDPDLGFYSRTTEQFGKSGDFYTSSDVHAVFGRLLARQFEEMWRLLGSPERIEIIELGPGRGLFAQDVLAWCQKKFPPFFRAVHYTLVERSVALRRRLEKGLADHLQSGKCAITDELPSAQDSDTILFANEFFDALPIEVLSSSGALRIADGESDFIELWSPASPRELEYLDRYAIHPAPGERVEVALLSHSVMAQAANLIRRGFVIAIDYGYTRNELLAGRYHGTIMTYRQHSVGANPFEAPGEQDITAHVNFTGLQAAAEQGEMQCQKMMTQSEFLMGIGEANEFADAFSDCHLPQERAKVALQLKHLVTPAGIGETFHVLVASKAVDSNSIAQISGLRFG